MMLRLPILVDAAATTRCYTRAPHDILPVLLRPSTLAAPAEATRSKFRLSQQILTVLLCLTTLAAAAQEMYDIVCGAIILSCSAPPHK